MYQSIIMLLIAIAEIIISDVIMKKIKGTSTISFIISLTLRIIVATVAIHLLVKVAATDSDIAILFGRAAIWVQCIPSIIGMLLIIDRICIKKKPRVTV
jgi:hypothetical protein